MKKFTLFALLCLIVFACNKTGLISDNSLKSPNLPSKSFEYSNLALPSKSITTKVNPNQFSQFTDGFGNIINVNNPSGSTSMVIDGKTFKVMSGIAANGLPFVQSIKNEVATLGRVLFYDKSLSVNNRVACGSCHHQDKAFSDGKATSGGFANQHGNRNSMAIVNPLLQNNLFWDSRVSSIIDLSMKPIENHLEMGFENIDLLSAKLNKIDYYKSLALKAYGTEELSNGDISNALSQFIASITSSNSKFDLGTLSEIEKVGQTVFENNCSTCHSGTNLAADDSPLGEYGGGGSDGQDLKGATSIGLDLVSKDLGVGEGKFRIPTMRNIMLTAPYMHDGRFATIDQVLDHYAKGLKPSKSLDKKLKHANGSPKFIVLNQAERTALKAFLNALTDQKLVSDPKYSDPFKY